MFPFVLNQYQTKVNYWYLIKKIFHLIILDYSIYKINHQKIQNYYFYGLAVEFNDFKILSRYVALNNDLLFCINGWSSVISIFIWAKVALLPIDVRFESAVSSALRFSKYSLIWSNCFCRFWSSL